MTLKEWIDKHHGGSRRQFSEAADVPAATLSRFFNGQGTLSTANVAKIVKYTRGRVRFTDLVASAEARP